MTPDIEDILRTHGRSTDHAEAAEAAAARASERAAAEGGADVSWASVDSPLGTLTAAITQRGLVQLSYPDIGPDLALERLSRRISPRVVEAPAALDDVRRQLDDYFEGRRRDFELPIDWELTTPGFTRRILQATTRIPFGEAGTYGSVARDAGSPKAVRAAGNALGSNPIPIVVPCHRILRTGGGLGGYTGGTEKKVYLLELEGVSV